VLVRVGRTIGHYISAALMLLVIPMLISHELGHAIPAMLGRDDDRRAFVYFGGTGRRVRFSVWRLAFSFGLPESAGLSPCCWWDWRGDSLRRKRTAIVGGPTSDAAWAVALLAAAVLTVGWVRVVFGFSAAVALGLLVNNLLPIKGRSDAWFFTHLDRVAEHPPCRAENVPLAESRS